MASENQESFATANLLKRINNSTMPEWAIGLLFNDGY
jgi:hypothetical protein